MKNICTPLLPIAVCLALGVIAADIWQPAMPMPPFFAGLVVVALLCRRWPLAQSVALCCCSLALGMATRQRAGGVGIAPLGKELEAVVMSEPAVRPRTLAVDLLVPDADGLTLRCYLHKDDSSLLLQPGDRMVVSSLRVMEGHGRRLPVYYVCRDCWHTGGDALGRMSRWQLLRLRFLRLRHGLLQHYRDLGAAGDEYAALAAMTLGDKSALSPGLRQTYSVSGASHVLALSGLHIGIVYMLLSLLTLGRRRYWLSQVFIVGSIWAFALLTGLSPSVTRSAAMISIYAVFSMRNGGRASVNVLCIAAIVMLLADAAILFDVGFQLSFASVLAILLFMPLLERLWHPRRRALRCLWGMVAVALCAQLGAAPLVAFHFGRFSVYFLLTNFIVVPAAMVVIYGALAALIAPQCSPALVYTVRQLNNALGVIAELPHSSIDGLHPSALQTCMVYVLILILYLILGRLAK